jgi:hypothetical protein
MTARALLQLKDLDCAGFELAVENLSKIHKRFAESSVIMPSSNPFVPTNQTTNAIEVSKPLPRSSQHASIAPSISSSRHSLGSPAHIPNSSISSGLKYQDKSGASANGIPWYMTKGTSCIISNY